MIAVGLSIGFQANVWNIGAEGQYVVGGLAGTGRRARHLAPRGRLVGAAADVRRRRARPGRPGRRSRRSCRTRINVNEILSSLMLTYVAIQLLYYLMNGPWKDPEGLQLPAEPAVPRTSRRCPTSPASAISTCRSPSSSRFVVWFVMAKTSFGFQIRTVGAAPHAARYGGFSARADDLGVAR